VTAPVPAAALIAERTYGGRPITDVGGDVIAVRECCPCRVHNDRSVAIRVFQICDPDDTPPDPEADEPDGTLLLTPVVLSSRGDIV
jgi:hypothetical protein